MSVIHKSNVEEAISNNPNSTASFNLAAANTQANGVRNVLAAYSNNVELPYFATDGSGLWESGVGTVTGSTLVRTLILESSNADAAVDFSAGALITLHVEWSANQGQSVSEGKRRVYSQAEINALVPSGFGVSSIERDDGVRFFSDGVTITEISGGAVDSVNGNTGVVVLDQTDIGLDNVDNTSDANKPISSSTQTALNGKEPANANIQTAVSQVEAGKRKVYTQAEINALVPSDFGVSSIERDDGVMFWCDGSSFTIKKTVINVKDYGAVGDGVTDDAASIRTAITAAKVDASANKRNLILFPPGSYNFSVNLDFGAFLDLDMTGAILVSTAQVANPRITIGAPGVECNSGSFKELNVDSTWLFYGASGHKYSSPGFTGIEFINITDCYISIKKVQNFTTAVRISADLFSAYNTFIFGSLVSCKININIHSISSNGWVNENKFYSGNMQSTSNLNRFGTTIGVLFTSNAGGYRGHNNNVFFSPSFQLSSGTAFPASSTVNQFERYYNPNTFLEYFVMSAGEDQTTGTSAPTHTSGLATDSNGVQWLYVGKCRCSPVVYQDAGGDNRVSAARWEGGLGAFMLASGQSSSNAGSRSKGSLFEIQKKINVNLIGDSEINESILDDNVSASAGNYLTTYENNTLPSLSFTDLHKMAVESSVGVTVPGFEHSTIFSGASREYAINVEISSEGLYIKSHVDSISLRLDTSVLKRFTISFGLASYADNNGRLRIKCYDDQNTQYSDLNTASVARAWCSGASAVANEITLPGPITGKRSVGAHVDTKAVKVHIQGESSTKTVINAVMITASSAHTSTSNNIILSTVNALPTNPNLRYSFGTPVAGFFETGGEVIHNRDTSSAQPLFWTVRTTGLLAKAWVTATAYVRGQMVEDSGNVYEVNTSHTAGATFAGDSANFTLLGAVAVLRASTEVY